MDQEESKKYESIDALIMAAEVLERAESMAKEKFGLQDNYQLTNCCRNNFYNKVIENCKISNLCKENDKEDQLNLQRIDDFKELTADKNWSERYKSDNGISYRDWSYIKKKLKGFTTKGHCATLLVEQDEDTPTASEDEGYNKYNSMGVNNDVGDVTDDASECEEIIKLSHKSRKHKLSSISKNSKSKAIQDKGKTELIVPSKIQSKSLRPSSRKRRHGQPLPPADQSPPIKPLCCDSMTYVQSTDRPNLDCVSVPSLLNLHSPTDYKLPVLFQQVDI